METGNTLGIKLLHKLGIDSKDVTFIGIDCGAGDIALVRITRVVREGDELETVLEDYRLMERPVKPFNVEALVQELTDKAHAAMARSFRKSRRDHAARFAAHEQWRRYRASVGQTTGSVIEALNALGRRLSFSGEGGAGGSSGCGSKICNAISITNL